MTADTYNHENNTIHHSINRSQCHLPHGYWGNCK